MNKELEMLARRFIEFEGEEVPEKLSDNSIIDEDKSVRWNRQKVKNHNENRKAIILENKKQKNQLYEAWKQKVLEEIMKEGFTTKQAEHIYDFAYDEAGCIGDSTLVGIYDAVTYVVQFLNELKEG